jgi:hypothetical protein
VEVLHFPANFDHMCWLLNMSDEKGVYGVYNGINYFADLRMTFRQNFFFKIGLETNL